MDSAKIAVLKTLLYSDIFDFPLTHDELWRFLISDLSIDKALFDRTMEELLQKSIIARQESFYCLPQREFIVEKRKRRRGYAEKKLVIAKRVGMYLSFIPTIFFVGVSGNVATGNARKDDDIDFFIVTRMRTIWITRLLVLAILEIMRRRRRRGQKNVSDTICVNMMIDESSLRFASDRRDLFTAHELVQLRPLFARSSPDRHLAVNTWVKGFMPNCFVLSDVNAHSLKGGKTFFNVFASKVLSYLDPVAKQLQLFIMRNRRTTEVISDSFLAFHPTDYRKRTLAEFSKRLERYGAV